MTVVHTGVLEVSVDPDETSHLLDELATAYPAATDEAYLADLTRLGARLPDELWDAVVAVRLRERAGAVVVRGALRDRDPGPTPAHWSAPRGDGAQPFDRWLLLVAGQFGDPCAWTTLQGGALIDDIIPEQGKESAQTGHGSAAELQFHVEDAFQDDRCDALALVCLRNEAAVPTTVLSVDALDLSSLDVDTLFEPRFVIEPDPEHVNGAAGGAAIASHARPALFGSRQLPYIRVDPFYTSPMPHDARAAAALDGLCQQISESMVDVPLERGDVLVVDNLRAVHGRRAFSAAYDGADRWLRKATVLRDLRKCRERRTDNGRITSPF